MTEQIHGKRFEIPRRDELIDGADRISDPEGHGRSIWFHLVPDSTTTGFPAN